MAINIAIGASAAGVTSAFRDIEAAIQRAGQTGKKFSDLDLSHPGLPQLAGGILAKRAIG